MKEEIKVYEDWSQVTVAQFEDLCDIQAAHPKDSAKYIVEYLYGIPNADNLPLPEYGCYLAGLRRFIGEPVMKSKLTPNCSYTINGREYRVDITPTAFTVAQYTDLTNYLKREGEGKARLVDLLAVVVVPEGKMYNEGYDLEQAKADLGELPVTAAFAVVGFFARWSTASIKTFLRCLTHSMRKGQMGKIDPKLLEKLEKEVKTLFSLMASPHTYSPTAASPSRR